MVMEKNGNSSGAVASATTTKNRYLSFAIGEEIFGIEIDVVKEIININTLGIVTVPHTPDYVKGIANLRGYIIPVICVRLRFLMEQKEYTDSTCIIVLEQKEGNIGLIVDGVNEVRHIDESRIAPPPSAKLSHINQFVKNLGKTEDSVMLLVDTQKLLHDEPHLI